MNSKEFYTKNVQLLSFKAGEEDRLLPLTAPEAMAFMSIFTHNESVEFMLMLKLMFGNPMTEEDDGISHLCIIPIEQNTGSVETNFNKAKDLAEQQKEPSEAKPELKTEGNVVHFPAPKTVQ